MRAEQTELKQWSVKMKQGDDQSEDSSCDRVLSFMFLQEFLREPHWFLHSFSLCLFTFTLQTCDFLLFVFKLVDVNLL